MYPTYVDQPDRGLKTKNYMYTIWANETPGTLFRVPGEGRRKKDIDLDFDFDGDRDGVSGPKGL